MKSNETKQMETTQLQSCTFYPIAKYPEPSNGVKMQQKLLSEVFTSRGTSNYEST